MQYLYVRQSRGHSGRSSAARCRAPSWLNIDSLNARADLVTIYDFTEGSFGAYQAEAYHAGLIRSFGLLADFPLIGQTVEELAADHRRFRFQSHLILYTVHPEFVEIRAIVHGAQDIRGQLFD